MCKLALLNPGVIHRVVVILVLHFTIKILKRLSFFHYESIRNSQILCTFILRQIRQFVFFHYSSVTILIMKTKRYSNQQITQGLAPVRQIYRILKFLLL